MTNDIVMRQLLTLRLTPHFGSAALNQVLEHYTLEQFFQLTAQQLAELKFKPQQIDALNNPNHSLIEQCIEWQQQPDQHVIHYLAEDYPPMLKQIASAPLVLFVKGNAELLHSPQLAVVGSRSLSITGQENAFQFSRQLAELGITITSGLALGVDGFSHKGALDANGHTIAVLGTGLNQLYPRRHRQLAQQIVLQGALVSEFMLEQNAKPENFPRRNRIISGLSYGTLVVEAAIKSGSLITARYALEQDREVFAIPGPVSNPMSKGCHYLIKQGASLVEDIYDIIHQVPAFGEHLLAQKQSLEQQKLNRLAHSNDDDPSKSSLIHHIGYDVTSVDCIVERSSLPVNDILAQLLDMELMGQIVAVPGGYLRKC